MNNGTHLSPFDVLGLHTFDGETWITTFQPAATLVYASCDGTRTELPRMHGDVFSGKISERHYTLLMNYADGSEYTTADP